MGDEMKHDDQVITALTQVIIFIVASLHGYFDNYHLQMLGAKALDIRYYVALVNISGHFVIIYTYIIIDCLTWPHIYY